MNVCIYCEQQSTCEKHCTKKIYYDVQEALDKRQFSEWGIQRRASRYIRKKENIGNSQNDNKEV